jgi:hypothetical protein
VDENNRKAMYKLRQTWQEIFPYRTLYEIDVRTKYIDPAWPITAKPPRPVATPAAAAASAATTVTSSATTSQASEASSSATTTETVTYQTPSTSLAKQPSDQVIAIVFNFRSKSRLINLRK